MELRPGDLAWEAFLRQVAEPPTSLRPGAAHVADAYESPNILFSSGTTGEPKAIPWTHLTPIRSAADAFFHQDVRQGGCGPQQPCSRPCGVLCVWVPCLWVPCVWGGQTGGLCVGWPVCVGCPVGCRSA